MFLPPPPSSARGRSRLRTTIVVVVVALAVLVVAAAALAVAEHDRIPSGTSIGGVDVGGKTPGQAAIAVRRAATRRVLEPVSLGFPEGDPPRSRERFSARSRGIEVAVKRAADAGVIGRMKARLGLGEPRRLALSFAFDPARVETLVDELDARVATPARDASVTFAADGTTRVSPARSGGQVNRGALVYRLRLLPPSVVVPIRDVPPLVSTVAAERAQAVADRLLSEAPVTLESTSVTLGRQRLRRAIRFEPGDGRLLVRLDLDVLESQLRPALKGLEQPARDARLVITTAGSVGIVPSAAGRELDVARIANSIVGNLRATAHRARFVPLALPSPRRTRGS